MNKKIKIIDLLCLISNGEEVPKKIKYGATEYEFSGYDTASKNYKCEYEGGFYSDLFSDIDGSCLNDEVEILNEEETNGYTIHISNGNFTGIKMYQDGNEIMSMDYSTEEEDKDIPLIPDDELHEFNTKEKILNLDKLNYNFKVLQEKINQVVEEFNEYRKENE